ncbi:MAG: ATP synthase F1 subunit gamma [Planctomycetota bacterium]|nr:ATP synthase F1 subunit gamma [Planctomycetota bacterium]
MANLRDLRKRRRAAANTRKITRTMELVASAKLKKAQDAAHASYPFAHTVHHLLETLAEAIDRVDQHPLMRERPVRTVTIYLMAADRGLCGSFNNNLVAKALERAAEHRARGRQVRFVALGKKGAAVLHFYGEPVHAVHTGVVGAPNYPACERIARQAMAEFLNGSSDLCEVVFARFLSAGKQEQQVCTLLPAGGDGDLSPPPPAAWRPDYIFNEEPQALFDVLIPRAICAQFYAYALQTTAAEHAARRLAMKNATDAASKMVRLLTTKYNRGRQGKITQEIAEIVGAVEAMV